MLRGEGLEQHWVPQVVGLAHRIKRPAEFTKRIAQRF
jgi:hypothetical protein